MRLRGWLGTIVVMEEEAARRVSSLIAGVLCSDGKMSDEERTFLKRVMEKLGLETDTALMPTYAQDVAEELDALSEDLRWQTLNLVLEAAAVDGKIDPSERAIVDVIANALGVAEADINDRLAKLV